MDEMPEAIKYIINQIENKTTSRQSKQVFVYRLVDLRDQLSAVIQKIEKSGMFDIKSKGSQ